MINGRDAQFFIPYQLTSFISTALECIKFANTFFPENFFLILSDIFFINQPTTNYFYYFFKKNGENRGTQKKINNS